MEAHVRESGSSQVERVLRYVETLDVVEARLQLHQEAAGAPKRFEHGLRRWIVGAHELHDAISLLAKGQTVINDVVDLRGN